ncbi:MAG: Nif11-like leader peptide family RiPP precursor [Oscillospiraceae bacterium]
MTTQEFIEKMSKDEALAKKLSECKAPEEAYEVAKEAGLTDDFEAFKTIMTAVNKRIKGELSDDELDDVAGGVDAIDVAFVVTTIVGSAGCAAGTCFAMTGSASAAAAV